MLANQSTGNYTPIPEGQHLAYCFGVIGLGTQTAEYSGKVKKQPKARLMFVLPELVDDDNQPRITSKAYTLSLHDKATLTIHLQSWMNRSMQEAEKKTYDLYERLGKPGIVQIVHKLGKDGKTRGIVTNVSAIPPFMIRAGMPPLPPNPMAEIKYDIADGQNAVFQKFPDYVKEAILKSEEEASEQAVAPQATNTTNSAAAAAPAIAVAPAPADDVPF